ncbi:MAG: hypothetical protein ACP5Q4_07825, partial [Candidatus Caldatribacteriaceae bacterium]
VYKVLLLNELGQNNPTLHQIDDLFQKGKEIVEQVIAHLEANDPPSCAQALSTLRVLAVGNNPLRPAPSAHVINYQSLGVTDWEPGLPDYPVAILLSLVKASVAYWRENGHPIYRNDTLLRILPHDPVTDTNAALDVFEPLLDTVIETGSILVNVSLLSE